MKRRLALLDTYRYEQQKYLKSGNPVRAADIISEAQGIIQPGLATLVAKLPRRLSSSVLAYLEGQAGRRRYLLTYSALIESRPGVSYLYPLDNMTTAKGDAHSGMVYILNQNGDEPTIGPMERAELFGQSIARAINGALSTLTCNSCRHYRRDRDFQRGNAGHCQYQPILLGNYDRCDHISPMRR